MPANDGIATPAGGESHGRKGLSVSLRFYELLSERRAPPGAINSAEGGEPGEGARGGNRVSPTGLPVASRLAEPVEDVADQVLPVVLLDLRELEDDCHHPLVAQHDG